MPTSSLSSALPADPAQLPRSLPALVILIAVALPIQAAALTVEGVDFDDPIVIEPGAGTSLTLTTTGDVYVYVPNGLFVDSLTIDVDLAIFVEGTVVDINDPLLCTSGCPLDTYDETQDVLLEIFDPVGDLEIYATRIVVSPLPIPEPSTALTVMMGLTCLALRRTRARST